MKAFPVLIAALTLLVQLHPTMAQSDLNAASITPLTEEIKPWPEYEVGGNGFNSLDMTPFLKGRNFPACCLFGHDALSPCGPVQFYYSITPQGGVRGGYFDGLLVDGADYDDPRWFGLSVLTSPADSQGFGLDVTAGAYYSTNNIAAVSYTAFRMEDFSEIISPTHTISATSYVNSNGEMHLVQLHSEVDAVAGQSIPAGTIENHPSRTPGTGASRSCGIEALIGADYVVVVTEDRTGGDPGAVFGFSNPGQPIIVITIYEDNGNVFVPSFAYPHAGRNAPARQSVAEGRVDGTFGFPLEPWFIVRTSINTATVFDENGNAVKDLGDYLAGAPLPPGIVSLEPGGEERAVAAGRNLGYIAVRGIDESGKHHPCVVVVKVEEDLSDATVIDVIQADDDLMDPLDFSDATAMDLYAQPGEGYLIVAWRLGGDQAPVARFYDIDQTPMSPTFWVSTLEENDQNSGENTIKCAADDTFGGVAWYSESFNPGLNCRGEQIERDTVFRLFHPPWAGPPPTETPTPTITPTATSTPTATPTYPTDINLDGAVNAEDLLILLEDWGKVSGVD